MKYCVAPVTLLYVIIQDRNRVRQHIRRNALKNLSAEDGPDVKDNSRRNRRYNHVFVRLSGDISFLQRSCVILGGRYVEPPCKCQTHPLVMFCSETLLSRLVNASTSSVRFNDLVSACLISSPRLPVPSFGTSSWMLFSHRNGGR